MSLTEVSAILVPVGVLLTGIAAIISAIVSLLTRGETKQLRVEINSRMTELIETAARASRSEGMAAGRLQEEKRQITAGVLEQ